MRLLQIFPSCYFNNFIKDSFLLVGWLVGIFFFTIAWPFTPFLCKCPKEGKHTRINDNMKSTRYFIIRVTSLLVQHAPCTIQDFLRCIWSTGLILRPGQILVQRSLSYYWPCPGQQGSQHLMIIENYQWVFYPSFELWAE